MVRDYTHRDEVSSSATRLIFESDSHVSWVSEFKALFKVSLNTGFLPDKGGRVEYVQIQFDPDANNPSQLPDSVLR